MRDAEGQAQTAVAQQATYVTILMGANDVCTSSPATMTSVADFRVAVHGRDEHCLPPGFRLDRTSS